MGQSSQSHKENVAKVVSASSIEGFLVHRRVENKIFTVVKRLILYVDSAFPR